MTSPPTADPGAGLRRQRPLRVERERDDGRVLRRVLLRQLHDGRGVREPLAAGLAVGGGAIHLLIQHTAHHIKRAIREWPQLAMGGRFI